MTRNRSIAFLLAIFVLGADQISKQLILSWFSEGGAPLILTPFLNIIFAWNPGISFGLLRAGSWVTSMILVGMALGIVSFVLYNMWKTTRLLSLLSYGLILGGAIGNIIDRSIYGAVIDFIDFHLFGYHWYVFNIADSGIVIGAFLLILDVLFFEKDKS